MNRQTRHGRWPLVACVLLLLLLCSATRAHAQDALGFFKNYFVTGDYVAAGVALRGTGGTGIIDLTGANVPEGADIVAAFLYWQTVLKLQDGMEAGTVGATLDGESLSVDKNGIQFSIGRPVNPSGTAPCWSSGGATGASNGTHKAVSYRADVLRILQEPGTLGNVNVNRQFTVHLPDPGSNGNLTPSTSGATLVVIYRHPDRPLRSVVMYDGGFTLDNSNRILQQTLGGFFQASATPEARLTQVVADGQANFAEQLLFNGQPVGGSDPFSGPAWDTLTLPVTLLENASSATLRVEPMGSSFDCLSWTAIVLSTAVKDGDEDGLLDIWESSTTLLRDPNAKCPTTVTAAHCFLPNLRAMGADAQKQDIFIELNAMSTTGYTTAAQGAVAAHAHLPSRAVLERVAAAFASAPPRPRRFGAGTISGPIRLHFDVGNTYQSGLPSINQCANNWQPSCSIIPFGTGARGGEIILETIGCRLVAALTTCGGAFADYPGTVGWKSAFLLLKNQPLHRLNALGQPVAFDTLATSPSLEQQCLTAAFNCVRRFDRNRKDIFRYALFAHALGLPRTDDPSKPKNTSGIADGGGVGGGDLMVTLGLWDNYIGSEFIQASTLMHEMGHTLGLRHGGGAPVRVQAAPGETTPFAQPNCKSNYLSVMNYLFQVRGLFNLTTTGPQLDFSRQSLSMLNEGNLTENLSAQAGWSAMAHRTSWFAPVVNQELQSVIGQIVRRCDGTLLDPGAPLLVRVDGSTQTGLIDWNWDGVTTGTGIVQDINFNSATNDFNPAAPPNPVIPPINLTLAGYNDFDHLDLRQVASRRNAGSERLDGGLSVDVGFGDVGFGDVGFGDVGFGDVGFGDVGFGDVGFGDVGFGDVGFGDVGFGDVGFGDVGFGDVGAPPGELDLDAAAGLNGPHSLTATVLSNRIRLDWSAPHVGQAQSYTVYKVEGSSITPTTDITTVGNLVPTTAGNVTTVEDRDVRNRITYTYFVVAQLTEPLTDSPTDTGLTAPSNFVTVTK